MPAARLPLQHQELHVVRLSDEERVSGLLTEEHVGEAISAMHRDGLVVLENAVDTAHCVAPNEIMCADAKIMAQLSTTHFNDNSADGKPTGNMSQGPPLSPDLMYTDIWANQPASTVISSVLGPSPRVNYVNGNTALGGFGGARQRVHADLTFNFAPFPFAIVANYYLVDVSPANGSTELWLGSHRDTTIRDHRNGRPAGAPPGGEGEGEAGVRTGPAVGVVTGYDKALETEFGIRDELLEARRAFEPPVQPTVRRGSVVLRDLRLWHAGLANPGPDPRVMLAFVHTPWWYQCPARVVLPGSARALVGRWAGREVAPVRYRARFVAEDVDHRTVRFTPNFSSDNRGYLDMLPKDVVMGFVFRDEEGETEEEEESGK